MHDAATGANRTDYHLTGVNPGRDFTPKEIGDIRVAAEGDRSPSAATRMSPISLGVKSRPGLTPVRW